MTLIESANLKIEDAFLRAEKFYNKTFTRPKTIIFKRTGTNAGHCNYTRKELMFQLSMMEKEGDSFDPTYYHEVAHWIDKEVNGYSYKPSGRRDIHGKKWQYIMKYVMRLEASRCHSYDVSEVKRSRTTYSYFCERGHSHTLSSVIHNRMTSGRKSYKCKCGGKLSLKVPSRNEQMEALRKQIAELEKRYV
jgi:SprT protein